MTGHLDALKGLLDHALGDQSGPVSRLLWQRALVPAFQPIVSLADGAVHAHEALIRGPRGMPLHAPDALFAAAAREGLSHDLEVACVVLALERWMAMGQAGRLFVNLSASALVRCFEGWPGDLIAERIERFGLRRGMLVFEITEHERVADIASLVAVADEVHAAGIALALDDFGDGRSSLRLWSELCPDLVKIDKYFTRDISQHAKKLKTIRALMQIAESFGTALVAEGIETGEDLRVLRDLEIQFGQGYFIGRPDWASREAIADEAGAVLRDGCIAVMPVQRVASSPGRLNRSQIIDVPPIPPQTSNDAVFRLFNLHPGWHAIAVVEDGRPVGLLGRQGFLDRYAKQYFHELFGRKPCADFATRMPTLIEVDAGIDALVQVLTSPDQRYLTEGFIYVENGCYRGLGTGHQLVRQVTESRIEAARHANPLTLLPGNIPISEHIERLLASRTDFVACYADLLNFKPFNDYYGYWRGDEMIKLLAVTLSAHCDPRRDFIGHVGGDDFVVLFQSRDWHDRCQRIVAAFNAAAIRLYDDEARGAGGIVAEGRDGVRRHFGFTSVYLGIVEARAQTRMRTASDVANAAARAKQLAKVGGVNVLVA